jgi:hypothetical protein
MILIDDQPYNRPCAADKTVRELAHEVCADPDSRACRLVVAVYRDGQPVVADQLGAILDSPIASFDDLALQTQPVAALVRSTLDQALGMLAEASAARTAAADLLDRGRQPEAMQQIQKLLEIWRQLQQSLSFSAEALGINLDSLEADGCRFPDLVNTMKATLQDLREAMRNQDSVLIADLLRYEMEDVFNRWATLLAGLKASIPAS